MVSTVLAFSLVASFVALYLNIWLMLSIFDKKTSLFPSTPVAASLPFVSILIPAYNEQRTIQRTIRSVRELDYPKKKIEIIVLPNACKDSTAEKAKKMGAKVIEIMKPGKANALNIGTRKAKGSIIGVVDADTIVAKDSLKKMVGYFKDKEVGAVTTYARVNNPKGFLGKMQYIEYVFAGMIKKIFSLINSLYIATGTLSLMRKDIAMDVGFSDETHTEDMDFAISVIKKDYKIINCLDAYTYTNVPLKFKSLFRQRVRWYRGFMGNAKKHSDIMFTRKYFNLGSFVIPAGIIGALIGVALTGQFVYQSLKGVFVSTKMMFFLPFVDQIDVAVATMSMNPKLAMMNPYMTLLFAIIIFSSLSIVITSVKKLDNLKAKHAVLLPVYMFLYYFLIMMWWSVALVREAAGSRRKW